MEWRIRIYIETSFSQILKIVNGIAWYNVADAEKDYLDIEIWEEDSATSHDFIGCARL